jgi:iron-sulfur cluster assembly protein
MKIQPVSISNKAANEIREIITRKNIPEGYGLRIGIKGAGCAGISYMLGFDKKKEGDMEYTIDDITVYIEKRHTMYLIGLEVDFYEGADARGFSFVNPDLPVPDEAH